MSESTPPAFVLAVDIGGTKVDAAVVSATGALLRETLTRRPTGSQSDRAAIAASIRDAARTALAAAPLSTPIAAIGVGSAGPIDLPTRTISPLNLPSARGLGVDDLLGDLLPGAPITLALDGTCIALAEHWLGALVGADDALALVVSTGIGGGFIAGGAPVRGRTGNAGHLGQVPVRTRDPRHPLAGTVEEIAAGPGTVAWARAQGWTGTTGQELAVSYRDADPVAVAAVARSAQAVGEAIAIATTLYDLDAVAIAGGFALVADDYVERVAAAAHAAAPHPYGRGVRISGSTLSGDGPLLGAAALALRA